MFQAQAEVDAAINAVVESELSSTTVQSGPPGLWKRVRMLFDPKANLPTPVSTQLDDQCDVKKFRTRAGIADRGSLQHAVELALYRVLESLLLQYGRIPADRTIVSRAAVPLAASRWVAFRVAQHISPRIDAVISEEGFVRAPIREKPILISLKGASAAGKSSLRPLVKGQLNAQGVLPDGYATISPDVWRRLLLDYENLGEHYKYAGALTARELAIIDGKLDRHIRRRAKIEGGIPHLVVDRFRFDSFESEKVARVLHETYARHVDTLVMYFVITPPEELVERGWKRALLRGRYKAVEDFLGHAVEAYAGMPKLLFKWLSQPRPEYRFFFLDNRVKKGDFPKTIAFGTQGLMTILDPIALSNVDRYKFLNVMAKRREDVYFYPTAAAQREPDFDNSFIRECLKRIERVSFVDPIDNQEWAESIRGTVRLANPQVLNNEEKSKLISSLRAAGIEVVSS